MNTDVEDETFVTSYIKRRREDLAVLNAIALAHPDRYVPHGGGDPATIFGMHALRVVRGAVRRRQATQ